MIKGIILDLDNCIFDTRSLGDGTIGAVLEVLHSSDLSGQLKKEINDALWTDSLDIVIERFQVPQEIAEKMREAYRQIEIPENREVRTYGDETCIKSLPVKRILVTTGYRRFQESKIKRANIVHLFDEVVIDELDFKEKRKGKGKIFEEILVANKWNRNEALVVGDNPKSELGAAKSLGIFTVQILRPGVEKWPEADRHIYSLRELANII